MRGIHAKRNQNGLAAIIVATIIMIILSLITLGFARLMRREQRQALDRSLSSQAFYAAESAVNDAVRKIQDEANPYIDDKEACTQDSATFTGAVDGSLGSSYTCLLIDQSPPTLEYTQGSISTTSSKVIPIKASPLVKSGPSPKIGKISIAWEDPGLSTTTAGLSTTPIFGCPSPVTLPTFTTWSSKTPGMLRLDIIPADALDRTSLQNQTASLYLYPASNGCATATSSISFASYIGDNKGQIVKVNCAPADATRPRDCEISVDMDFAHQNTLYYMRVRSIYRNSDMTVRIYDTGTPQKQLAIRGAQVQIDATGKVNDVLRRVQVRVPVTKSYPIPEFVLQTTDSICKKLEVAPSPANIATNTCPL